MRARFLPVLLIAAVFPALPASATAAPAANPVGPAAGQLVQGYGSPDQPGLTAYLPLQARAAQGESGGFTAVAGSSPAVDASGVLTEVVAYAELNQMNGRLVTGVLPVEDVPAGTYYWQITSPGGSTTPIAFELLEAAPGAPPELTASRQELSPLGYRGIRVGMTLKQARHASHLSLKRSMEITPGCREASARGSKISVMFLKGHVARISAGYKNRKIQALGGISEGDPTASVAALFGRSVITTGHAYVAGWYWDVRYTAGPYAGRAIRYVSGPDGTVDDVIVGRPDAVSFVEGCL
jgi:hypothetical protein